MLDHNRSPMETHGSSQTQSAPSPLSNSNSTTAPSKPSYAPSAQNTATVPSKGFVAKQMKRANLSLFLFNALGSAIGVAMIIGSQSGSSRRSDGIWLLVIGVGLILLALWNFAQLLRRKFNPLAHPIWKGLASYGSPDEMAARLDAEMNTPPQKLGGALLTRGWMLQKSAFGMTCVPLEEVAWAFKKVTQHSHNGIPTGKTFEVVVNARNGTQLSVKTNKKNVDSVLETVSQRAPWAIMGHTPQLETVWAGNRAAMLNAVEERRREQGWTANGTISAETDGI